MYYNPYYIVEQSELVRNIFFEIAVLDVGSEESETDDDDDAADAGEDEAEDTALALDGGTLGIIGLVEHGDLFTDVIGGRAGRKGGIVGDLPAVLGGKTHNGAVGAAFIITAFVKPDDLAGDLESVLADHELAVG